MQIFFCMILPPRLVCLQATSGVLLNPETIAHALMADLWPGPSDSLFLCEHKYLCTLSAFADKDQ